MSNSPSAYGEFEEEPRPDFRHEEPEYIAPENRCRECGKEAVGMCSCCGAPICSMHVETQAGFCSDFSTYEFSKGKTLEVTDSLNDLKRAKIEILEDIEISGCLMEIEGPRKPDLFFPMDNLPEDRDQPVSELDIDKVEVQGQ